MQLEVLGHSVGAPTAAGACSSYLVTGGGATVLLDCGSGTLPLLLARGLEQRLDAIVISHMHRDHMLDLLPFSDLAAMSLLPLGAAPWRKPRLLVPKEGGFDTLAALNAIWYANREVPGAEAKPAALARLGRFADAFEVEDYGEEDRVGVGGMTLTFRRTRHSAPCFSPRLTDGDATLVYSADTGYTPEIAAHAAGADLFLCEATFLEPHPFWTDQHGHLTGEEAGRLAAEAGVKRLVLTHLGPDQDANAANLERARSRFAGIVDLAQTGLTLST